MPDLFDLLGDFNPDEQEPLSSGFEPVPAGNYTMMITASEWKETSKGGHMLALIAEICEGQYENRKVFINLNLDNPSEKAVEMAKRELGAICRAVCVAAPKDTSELLHKPFTAKIGIEPAKDGYSAKNKIVEYLPITIATKDTPKKTPWGK